MREIFKGRTVVGKTLSCFRFFFYTCSDSLTLQKTPLVLPVRENPLYTYVEEMSTFEIYH